MPIRREVKVTLSTPGRAQLCHDPAKIQLQLANRLPAACYVRTAASSSGSPPNVSHSLVVIARLRVLYPIYSHEHEGEYIGLR